jgi:hypothetical protein
LINEESGKVLPVQYSIKQVNPGNVIVIVQICTLSPFPFMKNSILIRFLSISLVLLATAGCRSGVVVGYPAPGSSAGKSLPPGQAKKVYGHQSARAFAPGQQKKVSQGTNAQGHGNKYKKSKKKK